MEPDSGNSDHTKAHSTGRRQFLKSIFGLSSMVEVKSAEAGVIPRGTFVWADLRTGQVGFPTGTSVKPGLPGSLMKLVGAAAIRQENLLPANETLECRGSIVIHKQRYSCQKAHGKLDLVQAVGYSCNVFFAQAAQALSAAMFLSYARKFGLNRSVSGYASGPFPNSVQGESQQYVLGLAEDFQPHALQVLQMSAVIGTRGKPPALFSAQDPDSAEDPVELVLDNPVWDVLSQGMQLAGRLGTARDLDCDNKLHLAVKTGTAPHGSTFQSWVTGYFPAEAPRHAFCARAQVGTSQSAAVPLAKNFLFSTEWP